MYYPLRCSDPDGFYPDSDPTFEEESDPDPDLDQQPCFKRLCLVLSMNPEAKANF